jgi:hypothetical protein
MSAIVPCHGVQNRRLLSDVGEFQFAAHACASFASGDISAFHLTGDDESLIHPDLSGRHPMLVIPAETQKNRKIQICPCTPEFCQLLDSTPQGARSGFVFNPQPMGNWPVTPR